MRLGEPELGGILDRDHPLAGLDERRERVQNGRLARTGAAADDHVPTAPHGGLELREQIVVEGPPRSQLGGIRSDARESPDRHGRAVDGEWRDHHVDARAVRQAAVRHRAELVDPAADRTEHALDHVAQSLLSRERDVGSDQAAPSFDPDLPVTVDQNLLDVRVPEQLLQRPEADRVAKDAIGDGFPARPREQCRLVVDQVADGVGERRWIVVARDRERPALVDQSIPQLHGESTDVIRGLGSHDAGISLISRAKFSASIRSRACSLVRAKVALQLSPPTVVASAGSAGAPRSGGRSRPPHGPGPYLR